MLGKIIMNGQFIFLSAFDSKIYRNFIKDSLIFSDRFSCGIEFRLFK